MQHIYSVPHAVYAQLCTHDYVLAQTPRANIRRDSKQKRNKKPSYIGHRKRKIFFPMLRIERKKRLKKSSGIRRFNLSTSQRLAMPQMMLPRVELFLNDT